MLRDALAFTNKSRFPHSGGQEFKEIRQKMQSSMIQLIFHSKFHFILTTQLSEQMLTDTLRLVSRINAKIKALAESRDRLRNYLVTFIRSLYSRQDIQIEESRLLIVKKMMDLE